jgi:hypothetical protein
MAKPSWVDAPAWAKWLSQDSDGEWFWHSEKPTIPDGKKAWVPQVGAFSQWARKTPTSDDWMLSLEARP